MKKLMLLAVASVFALVSMDAAAWRRCGAKSCERPCAKVCEPVCKPRCVNVVEEPKPAEKCCVRYVEVKEPCQYTKHIYWTCDCPQTCVDKSTGETGFGPANEEVQEVRTTAGSGNY